MNLFMQTAASLRLISLLSAVLILFGSGCKNSHAKLDDALASLNCNAEENFKNLRLTAPNGMTAVLQNGSSRAEFNNVKVKMLSAPQKNKDGVWSLDKASIDSMLRPLLFPERMVIRRILIDPGHGGSDPGAVGPGNEKEKDLNLALALAVKTALQEAGYTVFMTRESDVALQLAQRGVKDMPLDADIFISLHHNASRNDSANGMETFVLSPVRSQLKCRRSILLALLVQQELAPALAIRCRGVKYADFQVLRDASVPAILIEAGFMSNASEVKRCNTPEFRRKFAAALVTALKRAASL